ncbi:TPA: excisionase, partial [Staphylococcus aureus]|nr:excisionase [Staphylococcus aureus]HDJ3803736.1 excisionase [Staphylococcus aureus]HDJ3859417.1 excisionase [Staphylococcus aureus]
IYEQIMLKIESEYKDIYLFRLIN